MYDTANSTYRDNQHYLGSNVGTYSSLMGIVASDGTKKLALFLGDVLVLYLSLYLTLALRWRAIPSYELWSQHFLPFTYLFGMWLLVFYIGDLYEIAVSKNEVKFYNRLLRALWMSCGITAVYFYFASEYLLRIRPEVVFIIFGFTASVLLAFWRYRYNAFVERPTLQRNVLVVGLNGGARELIKEFITNPQLGYRITAVVHNEPAEDLQLPGVTFYDESVSIKRLLVEENINTVVTAFDPRNNSRLIQQLFESLALKVQFLELPTFYEKVTGKIPITNIGHIWFLENLAQSDKSFYEFFKRFTDLVFATILMILSLPIIPFVILAIKLESKGPALFFQTRAGFLGKPFRAIKFRTMRVDSESDGVARWATKNDPRVTRVGKFLRKTRIDELPQLWNVFRGEMSVIGPRPERPEFVRSLERDIPFYNERHLVKPGLTGWAQIRFRYGSSVEDSFRKLEYDFFYIKNRSIPLDVAILLKTVSIVLNGSGQ